MDAPQKLPHGEGMAQVWRVIREKRRVSFLQLMAETNAHRDTIRGYLERLVYGGIVRKEEAPRTLPRYVLVRDVGPTPPRIAADGSMVERSDRQKMWEAMRIAKVFTVTDIVAHGFALENAKDYLGRLARAGILRRLEDRAGDKTRFQLVKDLGPKAPQITRKKEIHDPNLSPKAKAPYQRPARRRGVEKQPPTVGGGAGDGGGHLGSAGSGGTDSLFQGGGQPGAGAEVQG